MELFAVLGRMAPPQLDELYRKFGVAPGFHDPEGNYRHRVRY